MTFDAPILAALQTQPGSFFETTLCGAEMAASSARALRHHDADLLKIGAAKKILFTPGPANGEDLAGLFTAWRENPPSLLALIDVAARHFQIPADTPALSAAYLAAIAADAPHTNAYHSSHHFREVTVAMIQLCATDLAQGFSGLTPEDIAKCLLAAAGHDLLHDGKGNCGTPYKLEDRALKALEPFMALAGMAAQDQADIRCMIRMTDIGQKCPEAFKAIEADQKLHALTALMCDADLTPSTATNDAFSRFSTVNVMTEAGLTGDVTDLQKKFIIGFMKSGFTSDAGKFLSNPQLQALQAALQNPVPPAKARKDNGIRP